MATLKEVDRYNINPPKSINRHSCRIFNSSTGKRVKLDRTLDGAHPFFCAYDVSGTAIFPPRILIDGQEYWGDGWSWEQAINKLCESIS